MPEYSHNKFVFIFFKASMEKQARRSLKCLAQGKNSKSSGETLKEAVRKGQPLFIFHFRYMYNSLIFSRLIEKNKAKLEEKIRKILEIIDEGIAHDNLPDDEPPAPVDSNKLKKHIAQINPENLL